MTRFNIYNLTDGTVEVSTGLPMLRARHTHDEGEGSVTQALVVKPNATVGMEKLKVKRLFLHQTVGDGLRTFRVTIPGWWAKRGASWKAVNVHEDGESLGESPWRVYWYWPTKSLTIIPKRKMASFLGELPDSLSLASVMLPGTHDTMAFYGWPISQCQSLSTPLSTQFLDGIRVIDVRLAVVPIIPTPGGSRTDPTTFAPGAMDAAKNVVSEHPNALPTPQYKLIAYHGIYPQRTPFTTILGAIHAFLTSPEGSRETIVMSIKQEDFTVSPPTLFSQLVREEIQRSPGGFGNTAPDGSRDLGMWFLENRIPMLGEIRGKCVLFSRFGVNGKEWEGGWEGMGIHPLRWPDSEKRGFVWNQQVKGVKRARTHDWYAIPSFLAIPEKVALSTVILDPHVEVPLRLGPDGKLDPSENEKATEDGTQPVLNMTYLSAATFPLALPPTVAKGAGWPGFKLGFEGVNARVGRWLLEELSPALKTASPSSGKSSEAKPTSTYGATTQKPENEDKKVEERRERLRWFKPKASGGLLMSEHAASKKRLLHIEQEEGEARRVGEAKRLRGWALLDYYSSERDLVPLLVEFNWRGRIPGEEGWS